MGGKGQKGPRGSRSDLQAVKRNAEKAGRELDREQEESVTHLAQALNEISEGEALAHLDTRLSFIERQVDRLTSRREEMDRGLQGELAVMRARLEDALTAVGATAEEQRDTWVALEKRLTGLVSEGERRASSVIDTLRQEVVGRVQDATGRLEKFEARLRGEIKAFEEDSESRSRVLADSMADARQELETQVEERVQEVEASVRVALEEVDGSLGELKSGLVDDVGKRLGAVEEQAENRAGAVEKTLAASLEEIEKRLNATTTALESSVTQARSQFEAAFEERAAEILRTLAESADAADRRLAEGEGRIETRLGEFSERIAPMVEELDRNLQASKAQVEELFAAQRREIEGRLGEWHAEIRLESQRMRDGVEASLSKVDELLDAQKRDFLQRIRNSEEKATTSAIRLESMLEQQRREVASDEEEWSGAMTQMSEDLSAIRMRVDELLGRTSTLEARWATDRGSSQVALEGLASRIDVLEERVREAVEEVSAKQAIRLEMLSSQVSNLSDAEVAAEEQVGAVDYLKRRVAEMAERIDEIVVKVNAIGRAVTKPLLSSSRSAEGGAVADSLSDEVIRRLESLERGVARLAARPAPALPAAPPAPDPGLAERISSLERAIGALSKSISERDAHLSGRLDDLDRTETREPPSRDSASPPPAPEPRPQASPPAQAPPPLQPERTKTQQPLTPTILPQGRRRWR